MYQKTSAVVFKLLKRSIAGDDVGSHVTTFLSAAVSPSAGAREQGSESVDSVNSLLTTVKNSKCREGEREHKNVRNTLYKEIN